VPSPLDAYRSGYEKAKTDQLGGIAAEVTMGMLRDDPGGHFKRGYQDGAAGRAFNPPSTPAPHRRQTDGVIPKFSENPFGWFLGVLIVIELWAVWQLIKAPFELIGALMRSEKPSPSVIVRNVIVAGLAIALVSWVPHVRVPQSAPPALTAAPLAAPASPSALPTTRPSLYSVSLTEKDRVTTAVLIVNGQETALGEGDVGRFVLLGFNNPHDVMNMMCLEGQTLVGARSSTGTNVATAQLVNMASIELAPGMANNLIITCKQ